MNRLLFCAVLLAAASPLTPRKCLARDANRNSAPVCRFNSAAAQLATCGKPHYDRRGGRVNGLTFVVVSVVCTVGRYIDRPITSSCLYPVTAGAGPFSRYTEATGVPLDSIAIWSRMRTVVPRVVMIVVVVVVVVVALVAMVCALFLCGVLCCAAIQGCLQERHAQPILLLGNIFGLWRQHVCLSGFTELYHTIVRSGSESLDHQSRVLQVGGKARGRHDTIWCKPLLGSTTLERLLVRGVQGSVRTNTLTVSCVFSLNILVRSGAQNKKGASRRKHRESAPLKQTNPSSLFFASSRRLLVAMCVAVDFFPLFLSRLFFARNNMPIFFPGGKKSQSSAPHPLP